ncbi:hypothetical protein LZD49_29610 [Dyadobacter sp. CY261]|nr:hypothetical protein [Dyadobacter sp. CY261]
MLGKKESQVSKWVTGTHNFTIKTLALPEVKPGIPIFQVSSGAIQSDKKEMEEEVNATLFTPAKKSGRLYVETP